MKWLAREGGLWELKSFRLRRAVDMQFETIWRFVERAIASLPSAGVVLDVGAGRAPFRNKFPKGWRYVTVDPNVRADYRSTDDLPSGFRADVVMLLEVLEHVADPVGLLRNLKQYVADDGCLWMSVPFNARVHGAPDDFRRWAPSGLRLLLEESGWSIETLETRGDDFSTLASKVVFLCAHRLGRPAATLPALGGLMLFGVPLLVLGHLSVRYDLGNKDDALGFFVMAKKSLPR